jgi:hypothetical protein
MRKPYSPEIVLQVITKYILGESVREISDGMSVSVGYVSNCIENYTSNMEKGKIDAIHDFYKIIRKTGLQPKDALNGYAVFSILSRYNLDANQVHSFAESVLLLTKQNELSAEQLVNLCKTLSIVQSRSNVALEELDGYCDNLLVKKKQLEEEVVKIDSQYKQSKINLSNMLDKKGLTEKQVEKTEHALEFLKTIALDISDLSSVSDMLQNAKDKNYDVSELIIYFNQDKSLESALHEKQSRLDDIEAKTEKLTKKHEDLLLRNENLALRHDSMLKSIKSVEYLGKKGVVADVISVWQKIFDSFGLDPDEFTRELNHIGDKSKLISNLDGKKFKLTKDIAHLEKKKSWLENKTDELISEISNGTEFGKKNLKKITDDAESQINHAVTLATKSLDDLIKQNQTQTKLARKNTEEYFLDLTSKFKDFLTKSHNAAHYVGQMESLNPLRDLANGKFDPAISIPQIIIILDVLYTNIKGTDLDSSLLRSNIKSLREKLLDLTSHE